MNLGFRVEKYYQAEYNFQWNQQYLVTPGCSVLVSAQLTQPCTIGPTLPFKT